MGERNSPDAGETTLAAATAAIIAARWAVATPAPPLRHPSTNGNGHAGNGHSGNGYAHSDDLAEWRPAGPYGEPGFDAGLPPTSPAPHVAPPADTSPVSPAPYLQSQGSGLAAAATYFSAVAPEPVPEVFDRGRDSGLPGRDAGRDLPWEEVRTQVPPGFERRTFGPTEPEPPASRPTSPAAAPAASPSASPPWSIPEPRTDSVPSALLGVLPTSPSPMPASFAPPEPAPWTDSGWPDFPSDFPRDVEPPAAPAQPPPAAPSPAAPSAGGGGAPLPRRTPRPPDGDFPLFDEDPAEPAPDPLTQRQELNRIADFLRDDETVGAGARLEADDLDAVLVAIRAIPDVKDAQLRWNAQAGQTLRIEFADNADESDVTRAVVRLLRAKLGLAAQPSPEEPTVDSPFRPRGPVGGARPQRASASAPARGRPLPRPSGMDSPRLVIDNVTVTRLGAEATVEVRLRQPGGSVVLGEGRGPGVDAYLSRLAATAAGHAVDKALAAQAVPRGKVFIEHVSVVPFGVVEVAVVVLLLSHDTGAEQLSGSAIVADDPHAAVVRATLAALNRRLESLLA